MYRLITFACLMVAACGGGRATAPNPSNSSGQAAGETPPSSAELVAAVRASSIDVSSCVEASRKKPLRDAFAEMAAAMKQDASRQYMESGECTPASAPSDLWQTRAKPVDGAVWACTVWGTHAAADTTAQGQGDSEGEGEDSGFSVSFSLDAAGALQPASLGCI